MTLILDIDGVLLDWTGRQGKGTGFDDFVRPSLPYFNYYSPTQLKLIADSFEDIRWHTTWIDGDMVNTHWTPNTDFGPYPTAVSEVGETEAEFFGSTHKDRGGRQYAYHYLTPGRGGGDRLLSSDVLGEISDAVGRSGWWKLVGVAALLKAGKLPGKVVWVDDDIVRFKRSVYEVLDHFDATDRFRLIAPTQVWTRTDIEEAAEWLGE